MDNNISPDEVITDVADNTETTVDSPQVNALAEAMWNDAPLPAPVVDDTKPVETTIEEKPKEEFNTFDEIDYLKKNFEVDSIDAIKAEREELKTLRERKPEIKYENEFSEKLHKAIEAGKIKEVTKMLKEQEALEELTSKEVNKDTATDIIKMGMALKYKDLSASEIDYKFNKEFGIPKEPKQAVDELDEDFAARKFDWEDKVRDIEMNKIIEAKLLRPELESSKAKLVLPELEQAQQAPPKPTQEDLDNLKREQDEFVLTANKALNEFTGFGTQVKDKDVDFAVSYAPSKEEKELVGGIMQKFVENNYNANAIMRERWLNADKTINVGQMTKDMLRLTTADKSDAKIANDAAGQRMEHYLKTRKNINLKDVNDIQTSVNVDTKNHSETLQEQFWSN